MVASEMITTTKSKGRMAIPTQPSPTPKLVRMSRPSPRCSRRLEALIEKASPGKGSRRLRSKPSLCGAVLFKLCPDRRVVAKRERGRGDDSAVLVLGLQGELQGRRVLM